MTKEELIVRIHDLEWEDFEVKEAKSELPKSIWETVSAFSNTSGGWIVLGIKQIGKNFDIQGVDNIEKLEQDFLGTLRSQKFNMPLVAMPKRYDIGGKRILAFHIPSSPFKPIYYSNPRNSFIRMGSGDHHATDTEIMQMYHDQSFGIRSEMVVEGSDIKMLSQDSIRSYRDYLRSYDSLKDTEKLNKRDFCSRLNICNDKGELTYAGLLMFGKEPYTNRYVPTFCIDYIEVPGNSLADATTRYTYRIPEQSNIWDAFQIILRRLRNVVDTPFKLNKMGVAVNDMRQFEVIREAMLNFCMHSDQFSPIRSCIHVFNDRVEFINSGCFPKPVETIAGHFYSSLRNPTIAKLFRYTKMCENVGYGIDKLKTWKQLTGYDIVFENQRDMVCLTLPFKDIIDIQRTDVTQNVTQNVTINLTVRQKRILEILDADNNQTASEIAVMLSANIRTIRRDLASLQSKGILRRDGGSKTGHWVTLQK